jgi:hypothetical protein
MSLDARIIETRPHPEGVEILLGPREGGTFISAESGEVFNTPPSIPGQDSLVIVGATWTPHIGDAIWGGGNAAFIVSGGTEFPYHRTGYTRLKQKW